MFADALLKIVDSQAVTASAAGNNVIDLSQGGRDLFNGQPMALMLAVSSAAVGTGTYSIQLQTATDAAFTSPVAAGPAQTVAPAQLVTSSEQPVILPLPYGTLLRYIRLFITTGGTSPAVTFSAFIQPIDLIQKNRYFAKGYTVQ